MKADRSLCIAASIRSADPARVGDKVRSVIAAGAGWIRFDMMGATREEAGQ
jgi:pentose-5-phosphate-3-epimerase